MLNSLMNVNDRRRVNIKTVRILELCLFALLFSMVSAFIMADDGLNEEAWLHPARKFNSRLELRAVALINCDGGDSTVLGRTPSDTPIEIPKCCWWGIYASGDIDMAAVAEEVKAQSIQVFYLSESDITDAGLEPLKDFQNIRELEIFSCENLNLGFCFGISDAGLNHLKGIKTLQYLNFDMVKLEEEGIVTLKELPDLRVLSLWGDGITDTGLSFLKQHPNLREPRLSSCENLTKIGLAHIREIRNLRALTIYNCEQITAEDVEEFNRLAPHIMFSIFNAAKSVIKPNSSFKSGLSAWLGQIDGSIFSWRN